MDFYALGNFGIGHRNCDWFFPNVIEHATLSAGARVNHGVKVETTEEHVNRAADRGSCVSTCWFLLHFWGFNRSPNKKGN